MEHRSGNGEPETEGRNPMPNDSDVWFRTDGFRRVCYASYTASTTILPRKAKREPIRAPAVVGWREAPRANLPRDASLGFARPFATPRTIRDVEPGDAAGRSERHRRTDGTTECRIHLQTVLVVAEAQLRLPTANECSELADVALHAT